MENVPAFISIVFILTTFTTVLLFYKASNYSITTLVLLLVWLGLQGVIGISGFYTITTTLPPRFPLLVLPPFLLIIGLFVTAKGRKYVYNLNLKTLTILHVIRIPVELVLFWLFLHKAIPELMTFRGRNFDILAGLSAPLMFVFAFRKNQIKIKLLLVWNILCLGLLINIIVNAALSAPSPIQQFAFEQPNIAVLHFPFIWLPCCLVPLVLLSHLAAVAQLSNAKNIV